MFTNLFRILPSSFGALLLLVVLAGQALAQQMDFVHQFGTSGSDVVHGTAGDSSGVYAVGEAGGALPGQASAGASDAFIRRYDPSGNTLWTRQFGTTGNDNALAVALGPGGSAYVAGYAAGGLSGLAFSGGSADAYVRKYDASGNVVWTREFGTGGFDSANGITVDAQGNAYVAGQAFGALPGQTAAGSDDAYIRKLDTNGIDVWLRQFGTAQSDYASAISLDPLGGVDITGTTGGLLVGTQPIGGPDAFLRRYDTSGNTLWTRQFGSPTVDQGTGVAADASGVYVVGSISFQSELDFNAGDAYILKRDLGTGNLVWFQESNLAGRDAATSISLDNAGGIYVGGWALSRLPGQSGNGAAYVQKFDGSGNSQWIYQFGPSAGDTVEGLAAIAPDSAFVGGRTTGTFPDERSAGSVDAYAGRVSASAVSLNPTSLVFASQATGSSSATQNVTLTNASSGAISISGVTASGDFAAQSACPASLGAGASCTIGVTFSPSAAGSRAGQLSVTSSDANSPHSVALFGTGTVANDNFANASALSLTPNVTLGPIQGSTLGATMEAGEPPLSGTCFVLSGHQLLSSVWFKFTPSVSGPLHVATENPGTNFDTVLALYDNPSSVSALGTPVACDNNGDSLNPPRSTNPAWSSVMDAQVTAGHTYYLQLGGVGGAIAGNYSLTLQLTPGVPAISLTPGSLTFGTQTVGSQSRAQAVTMTNTGTGPLAISSVVSNTPEFTAANCAAVLQPGASCPIAVTFIPSGGGVRTGMVTVNSNAPTGPASVSVSGTGFVPVPSASVSPTSISFGPILLDAQSTPRHITLTSNGSGNLVVTGVSIGGVAATDYWVINDRCTNHVLTPGTSCGLDVVFAPSIIGTRNATLTIAHNAGSSSVALTGTGRFAKPGF